MDHYWWEAGCSRKLGFKQVGGGFASARSSPPLQGYRGGFSSKFCVLFLSPDSRPSCLTLPWGLLGIWKALFLMKKGSCCFSIWNVGEGMKVEGHKITLVRILIYLPTGHNAASFCIGPYLQNLCTLVGCKAQPNMNVVPAHCEIN